MRNQNKRKKPCKKKKKKKECLCVRGRRATPLPLLLSVFFHIRPKGPQPHTYESRRTQENGVYIWVRE